MNWNPFKKDVPKAEGNVYSLKEETFYNEAEEVIKYVLKDVDNLRKINKEDLNDKLSEVKKYIEDNKNLSEEELMKLGYIEDLYTSIINDKSREEIYFLIDAIQGDKSNGKQDIWDKYEPKLQQPSQQDINNHKKNGYHL